MLIAAFLAGSFSLQQRGCHARTFGSRSATLAAHHIRDYRQCGFHVQLWVGRLGKLDWIEHYLHVKKSSLDKAEHFMAGHGAWMGFFAFLPFLGSAITIVLGLMRASIIISLTSITIGKFLRYIY